MKVGLPDFNCDDCIYDCHYVMFFHRAPADNHVFCNYNPAISTDGNQEYLADQIRGTSFSS